LYDLLPTATPELALAAVFSGFTPSSFFEAFNPRDFLDFFAGDILFLLGLQVQGTGHSTNAAAENQLLPARRIAPGGQTAAQIEAAPMDAAALSN